MDKKKRGNLFLFLFGLPFAGVGIGMFGWLLLPAITDWYQMKSWKPVDAELLSMELVESRGDDSTTYRVEARYRYDYAANTWENDRVAIIGGNDNIGSYWQDLAARLEAQQAIGEPLTVYVNPENPREAVIDRDMRVGHLAFLGVFVLVFGGVGLLLVVAGLRAPRDEESAPAGRAESATPGAMAAAPWRDHAAWASPTFIANTKTGAIGAWIAAILWCAISGIGNFFIAEEIEKGNYGILFILLFDVVGIGLIVWAVRLTWSARKFGAVPLTMDPHPGAIGGDVGGYIDIPVAHDPSRAFHVTLSCTRVYVTGSGKNRSTHRDVKWHDEKWLQAEPLDPQRVRLWFRFEPPAGLPDAERESSDYHSWTLHVDAELPGLDFARDYELPVFATGLRSQRNIAAHVAASPTIDTAHIESLTHFEQIPGGAAMRFSAGRHWIAGLVMLLVFGGGFGGAGIAMLMLIEDDFLGRWFMGGIFSLVGALCAAGGLWLTGNGLRVEADAAGMRIRRWLFGIPVQSVDLSPADIVGIGMAQGATTSTGSRVTVFYELVVKTRDERVRTIGDGLRGMTQARQAGEAFAQYAGLKWLGEVDRSALFQARKAAYLARRGRDS